MDLFADWELNCRSADGFMEGLINFFLYWFWTYFVLWINGFIDKLWRIVNCDFYVETLIDG
jgi:hypothetical protein